MFFPLAKRERPSLFRDVKQALNPAFHPHTFRTMTDNPTADSVFGSSPSHDPFQAAKASALKAAEELQNPIMTYMAKLVTAVEVHIRKTGKGVNVFQRPLAFE